MDQFAAEEERRDANQGEVPFAETFVDALLHRMHRHQPSRGCGELATHVTLKGDFDAGTKRHGLSSPENSAETRAYSTQYAWLLLNDGRRLKRRNKTPGQETFDDGIGDMLTDNVSDFRVLRVGGPT